MIHSLEGCHIDSMINFQQIRGQNRGLTDQSQGRKLISEPIQLKMGNLIYCESERTPKSTGPSVALSFQSFDTGSSVVDN